MSLAPRIGVRRFWTEYEPDKSDPNKINEVDKVEYGPIGSLDRSANIERVSRLSKVVPSTDMSNPAIRAAAWRWEAIRPLYEAWKAGREAPVDGTPIAVLNSIPAEQADFLRSKGVKTIEDLAALTDTHIGRLNVANLRAYIAEARRYLESSDARKFAASMAEKEKQIANQEMQLADQQEQMRAMKQQMEELAEMVARQNMAKEAEPVQGEGEAAMTNPHEQAKRGPGRPKKEQEAA